MSRYVVMRRRKPVHLSDDGRVTLCGWKIKRPNRAVDRMLQIEPVWVSCDVCRRALTTIFTTIGPPAAP